MPLPEHLKIGLRGEQLAARYLTEHGYTIVTANFSTPAGETDIIATSPEGVLCFVEVKTRSPGGMLPPSEAVDRDKISRLQSNAAAFMKASHIKASEIRFDIAEVILYNLREADINIIENAF